METKTDKSKTRKSNHSDFAMMHITNVIDPAPDSQGCRTPD